jgi:HD-GYP domain-containing protein (c-di-GMP phosphodiesterase class II)
VLTVCDIFAALTEHRPYKPTQTPAEALAILACMVREGKLDGSIVRNLGQAFDIYIPTSDLAVAAKRPYLRA